MVQTVFTLLVAATASLASASPIALALDKRCGSIIMPTTQIQLKQSAPDTSFPNTAHTDQSVSVSQGDNGSSTSSPSWIFPPYYDFYTETILTSTRQSQRADRLHRPRRCLRLFSRHHFPLRLHHHPVRRPANPKRSHRPLSPSRKPNIQQHPPRRDPLRDRDRPRRPEHHHQQRGVSDCCGGRTRVRLRICGLDDTGVECAVD